MLYALAEYLQHYVGGFRLFGYLSVRAILGILTALIFCFVFGPQIIVRLQLLKFGQVIRRDGPQSHLAKTGTPTMGGAMILGAIAIATLLWADLSSRFIWFSLFVTLSFGLVGFADDWLKIRHKSPKGLSAKKKYFWLSLTGLITSIGIYVTARTVPETTLILPLLRSISPTGSTAWPSCPRCWWPRRWRCSPTPPATSSSPPTWAFPISPAWAS
jgi:phospho-N-acetylmuramoyl-pentapeptide-transferase